MSGSAKGYQKYLDITPTAKVLRSIGNTGKSMEMTLAEFADNSVDAGAASVGFTIRRKAGRGGLASVTVADDGAGMTAAKLQDCIRLGSLSGHSRQDLGKFGMGGTTSAISIGSRVTYMTRVKAGGVIVAVLDLDSIPEKATRIELESMHDASRAETRAFEEQMAKIKAKGDSGTVIIIEKPLAESATTAELAESDSEDVLMKFLGRAYRRYIERGVRFLVNGKAAAKIDPLRDLPGAKLFDDTVSLEGGVKVKVLIHELKSLGNEENAALGINTKTQGFYVFRNDREIMMASTLDVYSRGPDYNLMRAELTFSASDDLAMGADFLKSRARLQPKSAIALRRAIEDVLATVARNAQKRAESDAKPLDNKALPRVTGMLSSLVRQLDLPPSESAFPPNHGDGPTVSVGPTQTRKNTSAEGREGGSGGSGGSGNPRQVEVFVLESRGEKAVSSYHVPGPRGVPVIHLNTDHPQVKKWLKEDRPDDKLLELFFRAFGEMKARQIAKPGDDLFDLAREQASTAAALFYAAGRRQPAAANKA